MYRRRKTAQPLVGVLALGTLLAPAPARAQVPSVHPPMPDQKLYLHCQLAGAGKPVIIDAALQLPSAAAPAELTQVVELPAPLAPLRVRRYLPRAKLQQDVVPADGAAARPAVLLAVDGPRLNYKLWLIADDYQRNRLVSLIATWRYMAVANDQQRDELFRQFETELTRGPSLRVTRLDGSGFRELPVRVGVVNDLAELDCKLRVRAFYPDFAYDKQTGKPINQSDKRRNPAALVEIERGGQKEERWVFAKFPAFQAQQTQALPYRIVLDCPTDEERTKPDFVLVTVARKRHEVWGRHAGKITARRVAEKERTDVPGSRYTFQIARFIPSGRLVEQYSPSEARGAVAALQVEVATTSDNYTTVWLESGKRRTVSTEKGRFVVWFGPGRAVPTTQHALSPR